VKGQGKFDRRNVTQDESWVKKRGYIWERFKSRVSNFTGSGLTLRSIIHFELMLEQGERLESHFSLLQVEIQFSQHHLWKRLLLLPCIFWVPLLKSGGCTCVASIKIFCSVPLVFMSAFVSLPGCFYYHAVSCSLKSGIVIPPLLLFWLRMALASQGLS
jgi:hypothetical protein